MRRPNIILAEGQQIETVKDLTSVFESIASIEVAKIRAHAELSKDFFKLLWSHYLGLRVNPADTQWSTGEKGDRQAFIIISAESGLSGSIDQRLVERMVRDYDKNTTDIIVIGTHGATQLTQRGIPYIQHFQVPSSEEYIDVSPVVDAIKPYGKVIVYYEEYISLGVQEVKTIDLHANIESLGESVEAIDDIDFSHTVFEPSLETIIAEMETTMTNLTLSQAILESSLAQAASRFNAMTVAKKHANEMLSGYSTEFHRAKRADSDRRLREIMVTLKKRKAGV